MKTGTGLRAATPSGLVQAQRHRRRGELTAGLCAHQPACLVGTLSASFVAFIYLFFQAAMVWLQQLPVDLALSELLIWYLTACWTSHPWCFSTPQTETRNSPLVSGLPPSPPICSSVNCLAAYLPNSRSPNPGADFFSPSHGTCGSRIASGDYLKGSMAFDSSV